MFRSPWIGIAGLVLVVSGVFAVTIWFGDTTGVSGEAHTEFSPTPAPTRSAIIRLAEDAPVVGVSIGGRHRAYVLQAFMSPSTYIYNDMLGPVPVTVAFCNLNNCVQVYTAPDRDKPLDVKVVGADPTNVRSMSLKIGDYLYSHQSSAPIKLGDPAFPYIVTEYKRTTWSEWRKGHPDTDLYLGNLPLAPPDETTPLAPRP
ncbi:: DUF3179 [Gemmata massiliana]|uniref:: DUF3179 n=1 Tax=Gemmata massiliana TaxID=1210884 RepID=A0A6P2D539_9BACT|nr:DUF3179 domain-containing (seleno)protein [Gemmata massiliana]VTR94540.1 : DUF3179 [Gemmata massiliana]